MTNHETDRPAAVPPPMSRAAKAEALLLHFTAEAHRRKWNYDRGLDGDGVPVKSEAFDALHRLGEEMRVALEELRRVPAAVSVPPPAPRADDQAALRDRIRRAACEASGNGFMWGTDMLEPDEYGEVADAVLAGLAEPADQAAVLREAADEAETVAESLRKHHEFERSTGALDVMTELRRLADEATPVAAPSPPANEPGPAVAAVRALHQPMQRGPFTICAHCSGWDGKWRCLGVVTDYPCPTIRALDGEQQPGGPCVAGEQQNETPEADVLRCVCGDPVQLMDENDPASWIHSPGSDTRCLEARPRCPHCQMPHDLTPESLPVAVCESVRQRIADGERLHSEGDHSLCARVDCDVLREQPAAEVQDGATS